MPSEGVIWSNLKRWYKKAMTQNPIDSEHGRQREPTPCGRRRKTNSQSWVHNIPETRTFKVVYRIFSLIEPRSMYDFWVPGWKLHRYSDILLEKQLEKYSKFEDKKTKMIEISKIQNFWFFRKFENSDFRFFDFFLQIFVIKIFRFSIFRFFCSDFSIFDFSIFFSK